MKQLSPEFQAHLQSGVTTLCWCWKLSRRDGLIQGFTDHDRPLLIGDLLYEADSGFSASEVQSSLGLSVDNLTVSGALSSQSLSEADLTAGLYDNADIEIWRVNWQSLEQRVLMRKGNLGEVQRSPYAFQAEMRGLAHRLNQPMGRVYNYSCDADLGDTRCTITLTPVTGTASHIQDRRRFMAAGLEAHADGWFTHGRLLWTSGANQGLAMEIKRHGLSSLGTSLELWQAMPNPITALDMFDITTGCDKQFSTCKTKFSNSENFRGFPYMLGNDVLISGVTTGHSMTGGSRYGN